jgi:hypothetical protein
MNLTLVPVPSTKPGVDPARVVTEAVEISMRRIRERALSAMRAKRPSEEMLIPFGRLKYELVPMPFVLPVVDKVPARVVTDAVEMTTLRMR